MKRVAVIGAGAMGLSTAYFLLKQGYSVDIFESDEKAGGMAAHFDFDGISIERFYHFICKSDVALFALLKELEISDSVKWRPTSMGYFIEGNLHKWGDPCSLLKFPKLNLIEKIRYGAHMFYSTKITDWSMLDKQSAKSWITKWCGEKVYQLLWKRLFELKLYEYTDEISAAWIWTRIKRIGTSRKSIFQEELGYLDGGSETFINTIVERIEALGGTLHLKNKVTEIRIDERVKGIMANGIFYEFDQVISTIPIPYVRKIIPNLPINLKEQYDSIANIGVVCVITKLRKSISSHFWININDKNIDIPGIIEYSNLRQLSSHIVYIPYYMSQSHVNFNKPDDFFCSEVSSHLKKIKPDLEDADIESIQVSRLKYAQPICTKNFLTSLPDVVTPIKGLQIADTGYYYPEDRGLSESIKLARVLANGVV